MTASPTLKNNIKKRAKAISLGALKFGSYLALETLVPSEIVNKFLPQSHDKSLKFSTIEASRLQKSFNSNKRILSGVNLEVNASRNLSKSNNEIIIPISSYNANLTTYLAKKTDATKINNIEEDNFAILITKNPAQSKDGFLKKPSILLRTDKWFTLSYDFVYLPNAPSLSYVGKIISLGSSDSLRMGLEGILDQEVAKLVETSYNKNKWKFIDEDTAKDISVTVLKTLASWVKRLKDPSYLEQLLLAADGILSFSDISIQELKGRATKFKNQLKHEFGSDIPTLQREDIDVEIQLVDNNTLLYIFDPKTNLRAFRDFSIGVNLKTNKIVFSYNDINNSFNKKERRYDSPKVENWKTSVTDRKSLGNNQWEKFEIAVIESLKNTDTEVLEAFTGLIAAMK